MVWFQVDDGFYDHPKVKSIPRGTQRKGAVYLWTLAGSWNAKYRNDGLIPVDQIEELGSVRKDAQALIAVGLWHAELHDCWDPKCAPVPAGHFGFHQWAVNGQRTKEQVARDRESARERQSRRRSRRDTPPEPEEGNAR